MSLLLYTEIVQTEIFSIFFFFNTPTNELVQLKIIPNWVYFRSCSILSYKLLQAQAAMLDAILCDSYSVHVGIMRQFPLWDQIYRLMPLIG